MKEYAEKLTALRKKKQKTQAEVAEDLDIAKSLMSMYETGARNPSDANKIKLAAYYNTTVGELFFSGTN